MRIKCIVCIRIYAQKTNMRIKKFAVKNFRTLEKVEINFQSYYSAISGKNNSGKSNVLRAIRGILGTGVSIRVFQDEVFGYGQFNFKSDYTNWKSNQKEKESIEIALDIELDRTNDASLFRFITDLILKKEAETELAEENIVTLSINRIEDHEGRTVNKVLFGDKEIVDDFSVKEILRRIKTSESIIFHNSTEEDFPFSARGRDSVSNFISDKDKNDITTKMDTVLKVVRKSLKKQQDELSQLLGRLEDKYDVSLSIRGLNLERESIDISLKEKGFDVSLDDWGSGTKNRTRIFLSLLNAKKAQGNTADSERITPIVILEEPESFLHPSAQAEFGRILQALSAELGIQVIVATHSPYLLSHKNPESNVLVDRNFSPRAKEKGSIVVDTTGDNWYEPFALSLGINGLDFGPLKETIFNESSEILLVEGEYDKEYLELLRDDRHGSKKLNFEGEIYPYGGADNLKNTVLLRFIKNRYSKFLVTIDMDRFHSLKKSLETIGIKENENLIQIGINQTGKKCIEGLLPKSTLQKVYSENPDLVQASMENSSEKKDAQNKLKKLFVEQFKSEMEYTEDYFGEFYKLTKKLNKLLK